MSVTETFFSGCDADGQEGIWEYNGTAVVEIAQLESQPNEPYIDFTSVNGVVLFSGGGSDGLNGLYVTDGSTGGTIQLAPAGASNVEGLNPSDLTAFGGEVLFSGIDSTGLYGLWTSNGTSTGTYEIAGAGINPSGLTVFDGKVYFTSLRNKGLWTTDGTAAGTKEITGTSALAPVDMTLFNGKLYFVNNASSPDEGYLYSTDGTPTGTKKLLYLGDILDLTVVGGEMLFEAQDANGSDYDLFETNGVTVSEVPGTTGIFDNLQSADLGFGALSPDITQYANGKAVFEADDPSGALSLWVTDGTGAGTYELTNIAGQDPNGVFPSPGDPDFNAPDFAVIGGGEVVFDGVTSGGEAPDFGQTGLWVTDGSAVGTHLVSGSVQAGYTGALGLVPSSMAEVTLATQPVVSGLAFTLPDVVGPTAYFSGTVTPGAAAGGVTIYNGATELGVATVQYGRFTLNQQLAPGSYTNLLAKVVVNGHSVSQSANYGMVIGVTGEPYTDILDLKSSAGALTGQSFYASGNLYLQDSIEQFAGGSTVYVFQGGSYFSSVNYVAFDYYYSYGLFSGSKYFYYNPQGTNLPNTYYYSVDSISAGNSLFAVSYFYGSQNLTGDNYTGEEVDTTTGGLAVRVIYSGVSGAAYTQSEYDYVGGVYEGATYTFSAVPTGAAYSSYSEGFSAANVYEGSDFFFSNIGGQSTSTEEQDFNAAGQLERVVLSGVTGAAYSHLEEDFNAGVYTGYKALYTALKGVPYKQEEVDVSASGQLQKVIYSAFASAPYYSLEEDFSAGKLADEIYTFDNVSGQDYYAYQIEENSAGAALVKTLALNDGGHSIAAKASGQTLTSLGDDVMTGSGATHFVFQGIYGAGEIMNLASGDTVVLPKAEFATFAAMKAAASSLDGNIVIKPTDGDTLTLKGLTMNAFTALSGEFSFK